MSWVRIDDQFFNHPKARAAGLQGRALFIAGLCYWSRHETEGKVTHSDLRIIACSAKVFRYKQTARKLVAIGMWEQTRTGYSIPQSNFFRIVDKKEYFGSLRAHARDFAAEVFERDGHACIYCGQTADLTLDHIIPVTRGGGNNLSNLAAACRGCNSSKGAKTPEEWQRLCG